MSFYNTTPVKSRTTTAHVRPNVSPMSRQVGRSPPVTTDRYVRGSPSTHATPAPDRGSRTENAELVCRWISEDPVAQNTPEFHAITEVSLIKGMGMPQKLFRLLLHTLIKQIDVQWPQKIEEVEKFDSEVPSFLKSLGIPHLIKKSDLVAIHTSWDKCLSVLAYLCRLILESGDLCDYSAVDNVENEMFQLVMEYYQHHLHKPNTDEVFDEAYETIEEFWNKNIEHMRAACSMEERQATLLKEKIEDHERMLDDSHAKEADLYSWEQIYPSLKNKVITMEAKISESIEMKEELLSIRQKQDKDMEALLRQEKDLQEIVESQEIDVEMRDQYLASISKNKQQTEGEMKLISIKEKELAEAEKSLTFKIREIKQLVDDYNDQKKDLLAKLPSMKAKLSDLTLNTDKLEIHPDKYKLHSELQSKEDEILKQQKQIEATTKQNEKKLQDLLQKDKNKFLHDLEKQLQDLGDCETKTIFDAKKKENSAEEEVEFVTKNLQKVEQEIMMFHVQKRQTDIIESFNQAKAEHREVENMCQKELLDAKENLNELVLAIRSVTENRS